jgi:hypothetical protein
MSTFQHDEAENKDILLATPPGKRSFQLSKEPDEMTIKNTD